MNSHSRHIRRIIFYSIWKPVVNENGETQIKIIPVHQALQIAGRAGRYKTNWETVNASEIGHFFPRINTY